MIGIIGAMDIEVDILKGIIENPETRTISGIEFISGEAFGKSVVVAKCGIGKVFAAMCAEAMIMAYAPDLIINTGVAGSLTKELSTLDVAVSRAVVEHDFDTSALGDEPGHVCGLETKEIPADDAISRAIEGIIKGMGVNCRRGVIASGDRFISSSEAKDEIVRAHGAVACEMEGGAIGHVCHVNKVPFTVIRAISDSADDASGMDYPTFAKRAAAISSKIVEAFIMSI